LEAVVLRSSGCRLLGALHRAGGEGRLPAVLLLHGIPGHEKNLDLAAELRDHGIHCLHIFFRGSWGSEGTFTFDHLVPDARVALEWLATHPQVDPGRIAVAGISLGGWVALMLASQSDTVAAAVALSPLIDPAGAPLQAKFADEFAASLQGTSPQRVLEEWRAAAPISSVVARLANLPILLLTAGRDEFFPVDHYASLPSLLQRLTWVRFPRADHVFSDVRSGMRYTVCRWLLDLFDPVPHLPREVTSNGEAR
jgi:dienelactone hydrolase